MIHVCTSISLCRILWYWEISACYWMMVCWQNASHPAGNMPSAVCLVLGLFRSMGYALYFSLALCGRLLADLASHVLVMIIYSDARHDSITHYDQHWDSSSYPLPPSNHGSRIKWTTRASRP